MSAFDRIIGYESIKEELNQICDMIHNKDVYIKMGAKLPKGALLSGNPGLGKTMLCNAFIEESGLPCYTVRRNTDAKSFISTISKAFADAKKTAPSIVFLDDLDKFANEDDVHRDAEEYVAVQAGIDDVKDYEVFVIATVNDISKLPHSLTRAGRFDSIIYVEPPTDEDAKEIISYYLLNKKVGADVNMDDLSRMISYSSCAELETLLNDAAISAARKRKDFVEMSDLVASVLKNMYHTPDVEYSACDDDEIKNIALHEAGHLVCAEALSKGSVGLVSVRSRRARGNGGFTHMCKELDRPPYRVIVSLAGKAAVELYRSEHVASGCSSDLRAAVRLITDEIIGNAAAGFENISTAFSDSTYADTRREGVLHASLERYMLMAKDILIKNRALLEKVAKELHENGTLLYSDIQRLEDEAGVVPAGGVII